ncbi:MAG: ABC transporter permease, partial [Staphylococcus equorum]|nr:ABC transporter permease [Staphylococcus equorum]
MIISAIAQGFLWAILGIGLYITYRILNFPDLTVEGSFPLGAAVLVTSIRAGYSPFSATFLAILAGMLAGLVTALLYTKGKVPIILAGILVMSGLNSVMLYVMKGPNVSLLNYKTLFDRFSNLPNYFDVIIVSLILLIFLIASLIFFFYTSIGQAYIATG